MKPEQKIVDLLHEYLAGNIDDAGKITAALRTINIDVGLDEEDFRALAAAVEYFSADESPTGKQFARRHTSSKTADICSPRTRPIMKISAMLSSRRDAANPHECICLIGWRITSTLRLSAKKLPVMDALPITDFSRLMKGFGDHDTQTA